MPTCARSHVCNAYCFRVFLPLCLFVCVCVCADVKLLLLSPVQQGTQPSRSGLPVGPCLATLGTELQTHLTSGNPSWMGVLARVKKWCTKWKISTRAIPPKVGAAASLRCGWVRTKHYPTGVYANLDPIRWCHFTHGTLRNPPPRRYR